MDNDVEKAIARVWTILLRSKTVQSKTVFSRVAKDNLAPSSLADPKVKEQIDKLGYYDVMHELSKAELQALETLVSLGYVEKRRDRIYNAEWHYVAHPYVPHLSPSGVVGISGSMSAPFASFDLNSKQFKAFEQTATSFRSQVQAGKHPHITFFDFGVAFDYETDVYELNDRYFDALDVQYFESEHRLVVTLTEPYVRTHDNKASKELNYIKSIDAEDFLKHTAKVEEEVSGLEWKKKAIGIIIHKDEAYTIMPPGSTKENKKNEQKSIWQMPNFLEGGIYSHPNYMSRIFEDAVANFLRENYGYEATTRFKPKYLDGLEIDVFAEKKIKAREITICECKLRLNDSAITMSELDDFWKKIQTIKENEDRRGDTRFHFWLVTNAKALEDGVEDYAKKVGVDIMQAELSANWKKRSDWSVNKILIFGRKG